MGGDYSRLRFQPGKHFAAVLLQQGRVQRDSDWNEAESIRDHHLRTLVRDLVGPAAFVDGGFALSAGGERVTIGAGHAWIDGLLCELANDTDAEAQPDLPAVRLPTSRGSYVAFVEAWQRDVTAIEDPTLQDVALGGPDTTVRRGTIAQVRFKLVRGPVPRPAEWSLPADPSDATLAVRGRYEGSDNALYRVEIHDGGDEPTFKWSRDNASTVAALRTWTAGELVVGPAQRGYVPGDHLEVLDRVSILDRRPGPFVRVDDVEDNRLRVSSTGEPLSDGLIDPLVRRWDGGPPARVRLVSDPISLDAGLEVHFEGSGFRSGDYWLFAARTDDGSVTWPDAIEGSEPQSPHGVCVRRAPIAALRRGQAGWTVLRDLRLPPRGI
jgi:hypothetical protein